MRDFSDLSDAHCWRFSGRFFLGRVVVRVFMRRAVLVGFLAMVGCSGQQVDAPIVLEGTAKEKTQIEEAPESSPALVEVEVADWDTIQAWVQQQHGKVVVIDFWGDW